MSKYDMIGITIGERNHLTRDAAKQNARRFKEIAAAQPWAELCPIMHGYDDDPRGLWEIPEVRAYLCRWAQFAGIKNTSDADAYRIDANMCAVLAKCGVLDDVDPNEVIPGLES